MATFVNMLQVKDVKRTDRTKGYTGIKIPVNFFEENIELILDDESKDIIIGSVQDGKKHIEVGCGEKSDEIWVLTDAIRVMGGKPSKLKIVFLEGCMLVGLVEGIIGYRDNSGNYTNLSVGRVSTSQFSMDKSYKELYEILHSGNPDDYVNVIEVSINSVKVKENRVFKLKHIEKESELIDLGYYKRERARLEGIREKERLRKQKMEEERQIRLQKIEDDSIIRLAKADGLSDEVIEELCIERRKAHKNAEKFYTDYKKAHSELRKVDKLKDNVKGKVEKETINSNAMEFWKCVQENIKK